MKSSTTVKVVIVVLLFQFSVENDDDDEPHKETERNSVIFKDDDVYRFLSGKGWNYSRVESVNHSSQINDDYFQYKLWKVLRESDLPFRAGSVKKSSSQSPTSSSNATGTVKSATSKAKPTNSNNSSSNNEKNVDNSKAVNSDLNAVQQDHSSKSSSSSSSSSASNKVSQFGQSDLQYNQMFDYRALKRKEGEEGALHYDSVTKFKSQPPPEPKGPAGAAAGNSNSKNVLPSRPASVLWPGFNGK